jgi:hypothetical protein
MIGTADRTSAALSALMTGQDIDAAVGDSSPSEGAALHASDSEETESSSHESDEQPSSEQEDQDSEQVAAPEQDIEEVILTDESGKKKLKVDWKDKEKLKKYIQMAAGMRKFQAERDKLKQEYDGYKSASSDKVQAFEQLDRVWSKDGIEGVIKLLGGPEALSQFEQKAIERHQFLAKASPEQKKAFELEQQLLGERREREALQKSVEENLRRAEEQRSQASQKEAESMVFPAFEKYRFTGKLGDASLEHSLDEAVWTQTLSRLERLPEGSLSQAVIDREFRSVASTFSKAIQKQASSEAKKVVETKKADAKASVSAAAARGMSGAKQSNATRDKIAKGDLKGAFLDMLGGKKL